MIIMKPKSRRLSNTHKSHAKPSDALNVAWAKAQEEVQDTALSNYNATSGAKADKQNEITTSAYDCSKLSEALNVVEEKQRQASAERYKVRRAQDASMRFKLYQHRLLLSLFLGEKKCFDSMEIKGQSQ